MRRWLTANHAPFAPEMATSATMGSGTPRSFNPFR